MLRLHRVTSVFLLMILVCWTIVLTSCHNARPLFISKQTINPLQYGLKEAKTGIERYYVLKKTHEEAQRLGRGVSYFGIKEIEIEIPPKAESLPLTRYTDFAGVSLVVENNKKDFFLFVLSDKLIPVEVKGEDIDGQSFFQNPVLKSGNKLLIIKDHTPWVENRIGYDYGATRKDIMLVKNGISENGPVQSYCTSVSSPDCYYCEVDVSSGTVIKNLTFNRTNNSTKKTYLVKIENQYNVELSNITINTAEGSGLYGDKAINILNCVNVFFSDVAIHGTYSLSRKYGYGISLNNIYNLYVYGLYARANWGVFGNNNIHKAFLKKCDINRFDIHCYGKNIDFEDCTFVNLYNQFSSVYGDIRFKGCTFTNFTPILIEASYNAFTAFDVYFEDCKFDFDKIHSCIVSLSGFCDDDNSRPELKDKCLPNVTISDCHATISGGVNTLCVFNTKKAKNYKGVFSYISKIIIDGLLIDEKDVEVKNFSDKVETANKVQVSMK